MATTKLIVATINATPVYTGIAQAFKTAVKRS